MANKLCSTREILFRGKRTDNGEWAFGDLIREPYGTVIQYYEDEIKEKGNCAKTDSKKRIKVTVDSETVCRYTGLTDKNGGKIFEGDICEIHSSYIDEEDGLFVIEWDEYCAKTVLSGEDLKVDFDAFSGSDCEVVGNIYDNPELIGG